MYKSIQQMYVLFFFNFRYGKKILNMEEDFQRRTNILKTKLMKNIKQCISEQSSEISDTTCR